ncbi:MAG: hypothetical protein R3250_17885, partial [Melioribacteraceae bacterium]|nr:hypothetical protein [Melioribacteraceae bacterium]
YSYTKSGGEIMNSNEKLKNILTFTIFLAILWNFESYSKDLELIKEKSFSVKYGQLLTVKTDLGDIIIKSWDRQEVSVKIYGDRDAKNSVEFGFNKDEK